jgi:hypothetical protein
MRSVVVLSHELLQQGSKFLVILPGFVPEPGFERTNKAFGDAIGTQRVPGPVTSDKKGQSQTLTRAVVGDDQDGDPGRHDRQLGAALAEGQAFLFPGLVCFFSLS